MRTCHTRTLLTHVVSIANHFMVFDCLYVNHKMEYFETGLVYNLHVFKCGAFLTMANVPIRDN